MLLSDIYIPPALVCCLKRVTSWNRSSFSNHDYLKTCSLSSGIPPTPAAFFTTWPVAINISIYHRYLCSIS